MNKTFQESMHDSIGVAIGALMLGTAVFISVDFPEAVRWIDVVICLMAIGLVSK